MSLFVFSATSKVSGGIIRQLQRSGKFNKIVCGDLYNNYHPIERFMHLKDSLPQSDVEVTDVKITGKTSLVQAITAADQVLYITNDQYKLVAPKTRLITTIAKLTKEANTPLVMLTPSEYDHYGEENPIETAIASEIEAMEANPTATLIRTDLTFGEGSQLIGSSLAARIANGNSIFFNPTTQGVRRNPISVNNTSQAVIEALSSDNFNGESFFLQGEEEYSFNQIISLLEKATGKTAQLNASQLENIVNPLKDCIVGEKLYTPCYQNCMRVLNADWESPAYANGVEALLADVELDSMREVYGEGSIQEIQGASACRFRRFLYD